MTDIWSEHDGLSASVIARYNNPRSTIADTDEELFVSDEDEDESHWETPADEEPAVDVVIEISTDERQARRERQRLYRKGLIEPTKAKPFTRSLRGTGQRGVEERKKLAYYLSPKLNDRVRRAVQQSGVGRREFCILAIDNFLNNSVPHSNIPKTNLAFRDRKFVCDEVPSELWDRLDAYCRMSGKRRSVRIYQVVEAALSQAIEGE